MFHGKEVSFLNSNIEVHVKSQNLQKLEAKVAEVIEKLLNQFSVFFKTLR